MICEWSLENRANIRWYLSFFQLVGSEMGNNHLGHDWQSCERGQPDGGLLNIFLLIPHLEQGVKVEKMGQANQLPPNKLWVAPRCAEDSSL